MIDLVEEIKKDLESGNKYLNRDLINKTEVDLKYFIEEILKKINDINCLEIECERISRGYHSEDKSYYREIFITFIDNQMLNYISKTKKIKINEGNFDKKIYIDYDYDLTKEIIAKSLFILKIHLKVYEEDLLRNNYKIPETINIYSGVNDILDYKSSNFPLIKINNKYTYEELNKMCLDILEKLNKKNIGIASNDTLVYRNLKEKILSGKKLTKEEKTIALNLLNKRIDEIENSHSILKRSLGK